MGSIHRISAELPQQESPPPARNDTHRGAANSSPEIPDQNKEMRSGNVTAPQKVSPEVKTQAIDIRHEQPHPVRERRPRLDKHA